MIFQIFLKFILSLWNFIKTHWLKIITIKPIVDDLVLQNPSVCFYRLNYNFEVGSNSMSWPCVRIYVVKLQRHRNISLKILLLSFRIQKKAREKLFDLIPSIHVLLNYINIESNWWLWCHINQLLLELYQQAQKCRHL